MIFSKEIRIKVKMKSIFKKKKFSFIKSNINKLKDTNKKIIILFLISLSRHLVFFNCYNLLNFIIFVKSHKIF